jgi:dTDP-L-rhamnose 4-epimerase
MRPAGAMKVLVTGGAGLIGSHVVDQLLEKGYEVRVLDNLEPPTHLHGKPAWVPTEVEFLQGDMRSQDDLVRALDGVDFVSHQAAFGGFVPGISKYVHVNVLGTALLLELIVQRRLPVRKVVMASSQAVYGEGKYECAEHGVQSPPIRSVESLRAGRWEQPCRVCGGPLAPLPTDEQTPIDSTTPYAISKYGQERLLLSWGKTHGIPATALRYSVTYGPRQSISNPYTGVVSIFSTRMLNGLRPVVYEDGQQTRDFVYVGDVARANVHCLETPATDGEVYNVGSGRRTRVVDLIDVLRESYSLEIEPLMRGEFRPGEVRHLFSDSSKLRATGWTPQVPVREGIARYVEWIRTQGDVREYFSEAEKVMREMRAVQSVEADAR